MNVVVVVDISVSIMLIVNFMNGTMIKVKYNDIISIILLKMENGKDTLKY